MTKISIPALALSAMFFFTPSYAVAGEVEEGKELFDGPAGCAMCHRDGSKKFVGPGLAGTAKLHSDEWLARWLANPQKTWDENDPETQAMKKRLGKQNEPRTAMKRKKFLSEEEVRQVVAYLKTL